MCPFDFRTSFSGLSREGWEMVLEWVGVEDSGAAGASWGVSFRDTLRRSCKPSQEKHRTGKVSEPLSSYPLGARSQADMPMW